jgi:copper(I)-binding protein
MATKFPSSVGSTPMSLAKTFDQGMSLAGQIKTSAQSLRDQSAAGPVSASAIVGYVGGLASQRDQMAVVAATTGLGAYVQTQFPGLDIAAAYATMIAQVDATVAWIKANFPVAGTGELLERKFLTDGRTTPNTFSTASLANLRTTLDALVATID